MDWKQDKPEYTHDCEKCRFLGNGLRNRKQWVDLYVCPSENYLSVSVIFRTGNDPADYESAPLPIALRLSMSHADEMKRRIYADAIYRAVSEGVITKAMVADAAMSEMGR